MKRGRVAAVAIAAVAGVGALIGWLLLRPDGEEGGPGGRGSSVVHVAVAANFAEAHEELADRFEAATGYEVRTSTGSTGSLDAEIRDGAPYDLFLAADETRPRRLVLGGYAVPTSRFAYARGHLALWGPALDSVRADGVDLLEGSFTRLAIADPEAAPYGAAAMQLLARIGLPDSLRTRIVTRESVAQAYGFVKSGEAELGLVALSQVVDEPERTRWVVPGGLHIPIIQNGVLLRRAAENPAALAYRAFLRSEEAGEVMRTYGYTAPRW